MNRALPLLTTLAVFACASTAQADTTNPKRAEAEFRAGLDAMKAGHVSDACKRFADADRLDKKVGYVVNLARCESKEGRLVPSRETWKRALELATQTSDARRSDVEKGLRGAEEDVPRVEVTLDRQTSAQLDGTPIESDKLAAGAEIDLGKHALVFTKPGYATTRVEFEAKRTGERVKLAAPVLAADAPPPVALVDSAAATADATRPAPANTAVTLAPPISIAPASAAATPWPKFVAVGLAAGGVSALGMGGYFALRASSKNRESVVACPANQCADEAGVIKRTEAREAADLATIAFVTGGALAASGVAVWLLSPKSQTTVGVAPSPTATTFSLTTRY